MDHAGVVTFNGTPGIPSKIAGEVNFIRRIFKDPSRFIFIDKPFDLMAIVNHVKSCDEAESIETRILDQSNQLARVLLPIYIEADHMDNAHGLTSGEISRVTSELGVSRQATQCLQDARRISG